LLDKVDKVDAKLTATEREAEKVSRTVRRHATALAKTLPDDFRGKNASKYWNKTREFLTPFLPIDAHPSSSTIEEQDNESTGVANDASKANNENPD
jgi:hypothetical protein